MKSRGREDVYLTAVNSVLRPSGSAGLMVLDGTKSLREVAEGYPRALMTNPRHAESLAGMCVDALASGQNEASVRMAEAGRLSKSLSLIGTFACSMDRPGTGTWPKRRRRWQRWIW